MPDRWKTKVVTLEGGLVLNLDALLQGATKPGSLILGQNFEPALGGGYARINGYSKFSNTVIPGTGPVLASFVYRGGCIGARGTDIYYGTGSTWAKINGADTRTAAGFYSCDRYNFGTTNSNLVLTGVDGVNKPFKYDGTTYTVLTSAPTGASAVKQHCTYLFLAKDNILTFSAPGNDTDYNSANGAGQINVGFNIVGLGVWRNALYIFGTNSISKLTGTIFGGTAPNAVLSPVTSNIGCVARDSIREVAGDIVYLAPDGQRTIAGTQKIGDVELGTISKAIQTSLRVSAIANASAVCSVVVRQKSQYRLFVRDPSSSIANATGFLAGMRGQADGSIAWEWYTLKGIQASCADSDFFSQNELVLHGSYDGFVYQQEFGNSFDGRAVDAQLQIPFSPYDDPSLRKTLFKVLMFAEIGQTAAITISLLYDYEADINMQPAPITITKVSNVGLNWDDPGLVWDGGATYFNVNFDPRYSSNLIGSGFTVSIRLTSNDTNPPYTIKSLDTQYALGGRR